jgi:phosphoribosylaminoimidazole-succinocarboxamide synthase
MPVERTELPLRLLRRGKVRDVYEVDASTVLLVATDRVSAFDVVMREPIPRKGEVLTQITAWWLRQLGDRVRNHMISAEISEIVDRVPQLAGFSGELARRSMLCRRAEVFPVECVIRGYISGSAWKEYSNSGTLAGEQMPAGLVESDKMSRPIFSPATKAEEGHDENITIPAMAEIIGSNAASELERLTRLIYEFGSETARARGILIADTKLEFGYIPLGGAKSGSDKEFDPAGVILVDEVLTPDSSRFWPRDRYEPGHSQPSFDKQPLRDYLERERQAGRWNGESPPPPLPAAVIDAASERYLEIFERLTLAPLPSGAAS